MITRWRNAITRFDFIVASMVRQIVRSRSVVVVGDVVTADGAQLALLQTHLAVLVHDVPVLGRTFCQCRQHARFDRADVAKNL